MFTAQLHYNVSNDIPLLSLSTQNGKQDEKKKIYIYSLDSTRCFVRSHHPLSSKQRDNSPARNRWTKRHDTIASRSSSSSSFCLLGLSAKYLPLSASSKTSLPV